MMNFLRGREADLGLTGRYIIQGNSIRIEFRLVDVKSGRIDRGYAYSGVMDDNLLTTLDKYAKSRAEWIVEHVLTDVIKTSGATERGRYEKYLGRIRDSRIGLFIDNKWIFACLIIVTFYLLGTLISYFFNRFFARIPGIDRTSIDDAVIGKIRKILKSVMILLGCKVSMVALDIAPRIYNIINDVLSAVIILLTAYVVVKILEISLRSWGKGFANTVNPRVSRDLMPLFITLIKIFIASIVVIIILSKFDIDIAPFLASIGIMGIAIGFAVKDSLTDIIGAFPGHRSVDSSRRSGDY